MASHDAASHQALQAALQSRLGPAVAVVCRDVHGDPDSLWPEERGAVARAVPRRQREFAAGRSAARDAMRRLNWPASAIPACADRSPGWPAGLVGSITHSGDTCVAVVGRQDRWGSLGIDVEPDRGIDESLWASICTPDELRPIKAQPPLDAASFVTKVFVAKEAFYKWHHPRTGTLLDFLDVSVVWAANGEDFQVIRSRCSGAADVVPAHGQLLSLSGCVVAWVCDGVVPMVMKDAE